MFDQEYMYMEMISSLLVLLFIINLKLERASNGFNYLSGDAIAARREATEFFFISFCPDLEGDVTSWSEHLICIIINSQFFIVKCSLLLVRRCHCHKRRSI